MFWWRDWLTLFLFSFLDWTTWPLTSVRLSVSPGIRSWSAGESGSCALWTRRGQVGGQVFPLIRNDKFSPGPVPGDAGVPGLTGRRRLGWPKEGGGAEPAGESAILRNVVGLSEDEWATRLLAGGEFWSVASMLFKFSSPFCFHSSVFRHVIFSLRHSDEQQP